MPILVNVRQFLVKKKKPFLERLCKNFLLYFFIVVGVISGLALINRDVSFLAFLAPHTLFAWALLLISLIFLFCLIGLVGDYLEETFSSEIDQFGQFFEKTIESLSGLVLIIVAVAIIGLVGWIAYAFLSTAIHSMSVPVSIIIGALIIALAIKTNR